MAEMTVEKAVEWLTSDKAFGQECYSRKQIAALIEQQAAEIAKKDRMLNKACKRLSMTNMSIRTEKQWLAWLEKEAQGVE